MEIKINGSIDTRRQPVSSARAADGPAHASSAGAAARSGPGGDRLTLTGTAQSLLEIRSEPTSSAPVDRARVESIRESIENGTYRVRPERIAAALVRQDNG